MKPSDLVKMAENNEENSSSESPGNVSEEDEVISVCWLCVGVAINLVTIMRHCRTLHNVI